MDAILSRRAFIGATASTALIACAGPSSGTALASDVGARPMTDADVWSIEDLGEPQETMTADVIVVGGGGTGLAAGIQAKQLGLDVIVLEKHPFTGGSFIGTERAVCCWLALAERGG